MKSKKLVVGLLAMLAVVVTGFTYAYWAGNVLAAEKKDESNTVEIGRGDDVITSVNVSEQVGANQVLVPAGRTDESVVPTGKTVVESVVFTYTITWTEEDNQAPGTEGILLASVENLAVSAGNVGLVNASVSAASQDIMLGGNQVTVIITVTLSEPATMAEYQAIAGAVITFDVHFSVSAK